MPIGNIVQLPGAGKVSRTLEVVMRALLPNYLVGRWIAGNGPGTPLHDPVLGDELARVDATGLDLAAGFAFARAHGGPALRALGYRRRAELLAAVGGVLQANRDAYYELSTANSGTVRKDSAVDVEGAAYTLGYYAKLGAALPDAPFLDDGERARLGKDELFQSRHVLVPARGLALLVNAFNFPAWGLWEKAAPALLSGVPVVVKPATATAWLAQRMVADVVAAGILPEGALSVVCGAPDGLLDALEPFDVLAFTGSAETAERLRGHPAVARRSVRANVEADSVNSALLLPDEPPGSPAFELLVEEVVREMTIKSGQRCTAIRRIFVPERVRAAAAEALAARLAAVSVGNPRVEGVRMGALVSRAQLERVRAGVALLRAEAELLHDGEHHALAGADPSVAACVGPTLLGARDATGVEAARRLHDTEVFGPVATLLPYRDLEGALGLVRRGEGSLVASVYGSDPARLAATALALADTHGRVHVVSPDVAKTHTGHGNVMPQSLHGGPGRAGGGEELGGLRALGLYHRRAAVQASVAVLGALS